MGPPLFRPQEAALAREAHLVSAIVPLILSFAVLVRWPRTKTARTGLEFGLLLAIPPFLEEIVQIVHVHGHLESSGTPCGRTPSCGRGRFAVF